VAETIKITADTSQAQRSINQLQNNVDRLQKSLGGLKTALAGVAVGAFVMNAVRMADAIQDISSATGIAIENVLGFSRAVTLSGGSAEQANNAILKLTQSVGDAAAGSSQLQNSFGRVGVSLQDLATLSEQDILAKTIAGLNNITDSSQRASIQADIFGKTLRGVSLTEVAQKYSAATENSRQYAESVRKAAELQDKLDQALLRVQVTILKLIEPFANFINQLRPDQLERLIDGFVKMAAALAALAASARVFGIIAAGIGGLVGVWFSLKSVVSATGKTIQIQGGNFAKHWGAAQGIIGKLASAFVSLGYWVKAFFKFIVPRLAAMIPGVGGVIAVVYALNEAFAALTGVDIFKNIGDAIGTAYQKLKEFFGFARGQSGKPLYLSQEEVDNENKRLLARSRALEQEKQIREVTNKIRDEVLAGNAKIIDSYRQQVQERNRQLQQELELIGLSEEQREQTQRLAEAETAYLQQITSIQARYNELKEAANAGDADAKRRFEEFAKTQPAVLQQITDEYARQREAVLQLNGAIAQATAAEKLRLYQQQQQIDLSKQLRQLDGEYAKMGLGELQRAYYDVAEAANESARAAIQAEQARRGAALTATEEQAYYDTAKRGLDEVYAKMQRNYEASRSFQTGWSEAYRQFADDATNAANAARQMFGTMTRGIEDAIVGLVTKGKFNFRDLANSIIQDLIRIQVRKALVGAFNMGGGGGGGGGDFLSTAISFGSRLLGFAEGGSPPVGRASIVGENGPELFVPRQPGTIVPNSQMGMQQPVVNNYYYNNNITAMDAKSVAQVFAENRTALFGQVEMARREMPVRTR
jgi:lambda family phage tail tape measure protein